MKRISIFSILVFFLSFSFIVPVNAQDFLKRKVVKIGEPVPGFSLKDTHGNMVRRSDFAGTILMIVFWSAKCPYEKRYDPRINEIVKDYRNKGVVVIGIDSNQNETLSEINEAIQDRDVQFSILIDPGSLVADTFGAITTPHAFIIDRSGLLVYEGSIDDQGWSDKNPISQNYARNALNATINDEILVKQVTKPFGCTIKRSS